MAKQETCAALDNVTPNIGEACDGNKTSVDNDKNRISVSSLSFLVYYIYSRILFPKLIILDINYQAVVSIKMFLLD